MQKNSDDTIEGLRNRVSYNLPSYLCPCRSVCVSTKQLLIACYASFIALE